MQLRTTGGHRQLCRALGLPPVAISENHVQNGTTHARVLKTRRPSCQLVELLLEDLFFFYFADLVTDKLTVATEAYWVHS